MLDERITAGEIRGMLTLKKAELERTLSEEAEQLRQVESRLRQIEEEGSLADYDVVIKSVEAQPFLSVRQTFPGMGAAVAMLGNVVRTVTARVPSASRDTVVVVAYSDFDDEALDLEIGFSLKREVRKPIVLPGNVTMAMTELPAEAMLATVVRHGPNYESHSPRVHLARGWRRTVFRSRGRAAKSFFNSQAIRPRRRTPSWRCSSR